MPTIEETIKTLMEMGYDEALAKKALNKTSWNGVEQAVEWLLAHPDAGNEDDDDDEDEVPEGGDGVNAPPPKVLTPEEREAKLKALEELRVKKRKEREEREKQEAIERERKRIEDGKKLNEIRQEMADQEIKRMAEERRREKLETLQAKERIKAQIQDDREAKKREMQGLPPVAAQPEPAAAAPAAPARNYEEAKIQVRLSNGKTLVQTFKAKETLSAVRLYIQMHRDDVPNPSGQPVKLMTNFPKKVFEDEDYEKPLDALGLVPAAAVIVMK